jgi:hypothetical protein
MEENIVKTPIKSTVCKFVCQSVIQQGDSVNIKLSAQYDPNEDKDRAFSKYTPWGTFETNISNPNVMGFFEVGKAFYLEITPVETEQQ